MGITDSIKSVLGMENNSITVTVYECQECDNTFESAKTPDKATCMECLGSNVEPIGEAE